MQWGLFVVAVLLVAALQFAIWRRLQSGDLGASDSPGRNKNARHVDVYPGDTASDPQPGEDAVDPGVRLCPACGTENDADYRFCRSCVSALGP